MVIRVQESDLRRNASSVDQSRGPGLWFAFQGNILGDSTSKDTYPEGIGQRRVIKYLREGCYQHIECSAANSLAALMRK